MANGFAEAIMTVRRGLDGTFNSRSWGYLRVRLSRRSRWSINSKVLPAHWKTTPPNWSTILSFESSVLEKVSNGRTPRGAPTGVKTWTKGRGPHAHRILLQACQQNDLLLGYTRSMTIVSQSNGIASQRRSRRTKPAGDAIQQQASNVV